MAIGTSMARGAVGRPAAGGGSDARASPDPHRPHDQGRPWVRSATAHTLPALRDPLHRSLSPGTDHRSRVLGKGGSPGPGVGPRRASEGTPSAKRGSQSTLGPAHSLLANPAPQRHRFLSRLPHPAPATTSPIPHPTPRRPHHPSAAPPRTPIPSQPRPPPPPTPRGPTLPCLRGVPPALELARSVDNYQLGFVTAITTCEYRGSHGQGQPGQAGAPRGRGRAARSGRAVRGGGCPDHAGGDEAGRRVGPVRADQHRPDRLCETGGQGCLGWPTAGLGPAENMKPSVSQEQSSLPS